MAQDENNNIIDPLNGQIDLQNQIFKHASGAFSEDPLRAIRLARFFTYDHLKDFSINSSTIGKVNQIISHQMKYQNFHLKEFGRKHQGRYAALIQVIILKKLFPWI